MAEDVPARRHELHERYDARLIDGRWFAYDVEADRRLGSFVSEESARRHVEQMNAAAREGWGPP